MQTPIIELKEIIWEITSECYNNCSYCGSKDQCNEIANPYTIMAIADKIAEYPPKEINISGGDPLLVDLSQHKYIKEKLNKTKIKILINPKSLKNIEIDDPKYNILELYDAIGISVNTQEELNILADIYNNILYKANSHKPPTIITNFNLSNIFMIDNINSFCKENKNIWQVQFTIYKENKNELALYTKENELACKFLFDKINEALDNNTEIIIADNMNNGFCSAGINSLGILSDGTIIPCLSMRSWEANANDWSYLNLEKPANILEPQPNFAQNFPNLNAIWFSKFQKQRFCKHGCCKDHCNNIIFIRQESKQKQFIDAI